MEQTTIPDEIGQQWRSDIGEQAQKALRDRPAVSIVARLILAFFLWFILNVIIALISLFITSQVEDKLYFLETADIYTFEIQQARRFEKNYLLYHTNLDDALNHVAIAEEILKKAGNNIMSVVGEREFEKMGDRLSRYTELLAKLKFNGTNSRNVEIEIELREHGAEMVIAAKELVAKERYAVDAMLDISKKIPLIFLGILVLLITFLAIFFTRQILWPMKRMMAATRRIANGDFTPITPKRKYFDEFSKLAMAMNHMMQQLVHRQELLVQSHKLRAVGTLTAGIAHELNNPLNNIVLTASVFIEDYEDLPDEQRLEMLTDLVNESERAQKIVKNLLDFAREGEIESESLDIRSIVEETLRLAGNQIKLSKVKIKSELASNLPNIFGDHKQINQVFLNIILNALDAMPKGGNLTISVALSKNRDFINIGFADTGTGIAAEKLNHIFDPFFTTKTGGKGTGLGLSVSQTIIRKHGGNITVESQVEQGTVFTVSLPAAMIPANMSEDPNQQLIT
ncbi:MAG: HAMP domain-containing protein [Proteobacteria bacterium]|nr:HAMP domain-containing protein [Pseudomonadota bacterium]